MGIGKADSTVLDLVAGLSFVESVEMIIITDYKLIAPNLVGKGVKGEELSSQRVDDVLEVKFVIEAVVNDLFGCQRGDLEGVVV